MKGRPIQMPFSGEQALGVAPPLGATVDPLWNRRVHLYTGRSLSDTALTVEQTSRAGHLAATGAMLSSGVVRGLEVTVERNESGVTLVLSSGFGVTSSGEDVVVSTAQRIRVEDVPVVAPGIPVSETPEALRLGDLLATGDPVAGVLVLQPVAVELIGDFDPTDPCEQDPRNMAFEDRQVVDGCRLRFVLWPDSYTPRPAFGDQWRNRLAYALFEQERLQVSTDAPWQERGLPVALVGGEGGNLLFVDGAAVVRMGGKRPWRQGLLVRAGTPFLWQARLQQFAEQVAELQAETTPIETISQAFALLPPVGLLPKDALAFSLPEGGTIRSWANRFFPEGFTIDLAPVPIEQLDLIVAASASLSPLDVTRPERVQVLVPVPQVWFEPDLLRVDPVDPEFQTTIDRFVETRGKWLRRRQDLRDTAKALSRAITGTPVTYPTPDPEALESDEAVAEDPLGTEGLLAQPEDAYGTAAKRDANGAPVIDPVTGTPVLAVAAIDELRTYLDTSTILSDAEVVALDARGVEPFITFLEEKINRANDTIDFGFLQVQTNIYRVRQLMLGNDAASRLVTSPALASIAQGDSALATREDLANFLTEKTGAVPKGAPSSAGGSTASRTAMKAKAGGAVRSGVGLSTMFTGGGVSFSTERATVGASVDFNERVSDVIARGETVALGGKPSVSDVVKAETSGGLLGLAATRKMASTQDVLNQAPIVGKPLDFRTVTVAERLKEPPAPEAKNFSVGTKFDMVSSLTQLDLNIDDLKVPGFLENRAGRQVPVEKSIKEIRDGNLAAQILQGLHDPDPVDGDEGAFFSAGVRAIDHTVATLRIVEGRIEGYRQAVARCRQTLATVNTLWGQLDQRLHLIGQELAEVRHDVSVARALLDEETARVHAINDRRGRILQEHVPFYAFVRPREVNLYTEVPVRPLDPGLTESPVPACLAGHDEVPQELRAMVALFRQAPVKWFPRFPSIVEKLDRLETIQNTIMDAKGLLQVRGAMEAVANPIRVSAQSDTGRLGQAIQSVYTAQYSVMAERRLDLARFDASPLAGATWTQALSRAQDLLSLGDLLEGRHGRAEITSQVSQELANVANVAACLYTQFGEVRPVLRLEWAERLSQFDDAVNLRNLSALPRWGEVDSLARRSMQMLVDWLYARVDAVNPQAVGLMHDLVRMCLLLASHAPVNQIIAGHVEKPTRVKPGSRVPVTITPGAVRIGMQVFMYSGAQVVARGLVEDVGDRQAVVQVVYTATPTVMLTEQAVVHFTNTAGAAPILGGGRMSKSRAVGR